MKSSSRDAWINTSCFRVWNYKLSVPLRWLVGAETILASFTVVSVILFWMVNSFLGCLNTFFNCIDYVRWNGRMIINHELGSTWKGEVIPISAFAWNDLKKETKEFIQDTRSLVRDSDSTLLRYESWELNSAWLCQSIPLKDTVTRALRSDSVLSLLV